MKTFKSDYLDTKIWFPDSNLDSIKTGYREKLTPIILHSYICLKLIM